MINWINDLDLHRRAGLETVNSDDCSAGYVGIANYNIKFTDTANVLCNDCIFEMSPAETCMSKCDNLGISQQTHMKLHYSLDSLEDHLYGQLKL